MTAWLFIRPLDVLYLRGNKLFGGPGDHAEALMPPWPSVLSGAIRSAMLARSGADLGCFTDEDATHTDTELAEVLGTPIEPGSFRVTFVGLGREVGASRELLVPLPADLVVFERKSEKDGTTGGAGKSTPRHVERLSLVDPAALNVSTSIPLARLPVLASAEREKPASGYWLTGQGLATYLNGGTPKLDHLVHRRDLWQTDARLGIARSRDSYTGIPGKIYTTDTVALTPGVGFVVGIDGCPESLLPVSTLLRLGGDGRGAEVTRWEGPTPRHEPAKAGEPFVALLTTPGLFPSGWRPPESVARLLAAAVPQAETVSGWDLAAHRPKPAQRAVPAGAVYYFDQVKGDPNRYPQMVWELVQEQLVQGGGPAAWDTVWKQRQAEGFNNLLVGAWPTPRGGANV
jgi:CRISPR-associated protein Cmr3